MAIGDADERDQIRSLSRYSRCHFYAFLHVDFALLCMVQVNHSHLVASASSTQMIFFIALCDIRTPCPRTRLIYPDRVRLEKKKTRPDTQPEIC